MELWDAAKKINKKHGRFICGPWKTHMGRKEILMTAQEYLTNAEMLKLMEFLDDLLINREEY